MKYNKNLCITKDDGTLIYVDNIDTNETIMIDKEYIFLENVKTTKDIIISKKTIVLGDIECNFLNAIEDVVCYGNIKANTIFINKNIDYFREISYSRIMGRNIDKAHLKIENNTLKNKLIIVNEIKEEVRDFINRELIPLDEKVLVEGLKKLGFTFVEYKKYSEILANIINYSQKLKIKTLNEYIEFLNTIKELPKWLEGIDFVEKTIDKHWIVNADMLLHLDIIVESQEDFVSLLGGISNCKNILDNTYEYVCNLVISKYCDDSKEKNQEEGVVAYSKTKSNLEPAFMRKVKTEDERVKTVLVKDEANVVINCINNIIDELELEDIVIKDTKKLKSKDEYVVLVNSKNGSYIGEEIEKMKSEANEKLSGENISIYEYNKNILVLIRNITNADVKELNFDYANSVCNIICDDNDYDELKQNEEAIQLFSGYRVVNIIKDTEGEDY